MDQSGSINWDQYGNVWFEWRQWCDLDRGLFWSGQVPCHRVNFSGIASVNSLNFNRKDLWERIHLQGHLGRLGLYPTFEIN